MLWVINPDSQRIMLFTYMKLPECTCARMNALDPCVEYYSQ